MVNALNQFPVTMPAPPTTPRSDAFDQLPVAYAELDAKGAITRANRATLALYPPEHGNMIGKTTWAFMPSAEQERCCAEYVAQMESGEDPPVVQRCFYTRAGEFRIYELHRNLIRGESGRAAGMRVVSLDVTEKQKSLDESLSNNERLESILESLQQAVVVTDAMGFVRFLNPAAERLSGWNRRELIGMSIDDALPNVSSGCPDLTTLAASAMLDRPTKSIATVLDRERNRLRVQIETSPIVDKKTGSTSGVVTLLHKLEDAG